jgi:POT family proton-dependent oligopeptide transporter
MKDMAQWNEGDWIAALAAVALVAVLAIGGLIAVRKRETVAGHPRGLFVLFYVEMWERFSTTGMLLVCYLTKHWLFDDGKANPTAPTGAGLHHAGARRVADRWLGQRKAVLFGGVPLAPVTG